MRFAQKAPLIAFVVSMAVVVGVTALIEQRLADRGAQYNEWALLSVLNARASALSEHLEALEEETLLLAQNDTILNAMAAFDAAFDAIGEDSRFQLRRSYITDNPYSVRQRYRLADDGRDTPYSLTHNRYHKAIHTLTSPRGLYDAFLVNKRGDLVYSVLKEQDFGTNLITGPWRETGLSRVVRAVFANTDDKRVHFEDFGLYRPSAGEPAAFIAVPLHAGADNEFIGVLALQIPQAPIQNILQAGFDTEDQGNIYLVGPDFLLRSDMLDREWGTMLRSKREHEGIIEALEGETVFLDDVSAFGRPAFGGYRPIDFFGVRYVLALEAPASGFKDREQEIVVWVGSLMAAAALIMTLFMWWRERVIANRVEGFKRHLESGADPHDDIAGNDSFSSLAQAITQYRDRSQNLLQAEQEYVRLFEAFGFGTYRRSADGRLLQANETMAKIYGFFSPEELLWAAQSGSWKPYADDRPNSDCYTVWDQSEDGARVEAKAFRQDGAEIWISENCKTIRDANGDVVFYEGVVSDISERYRIEEDIRNARRELAETTNRLQTALNTMPIGLVMIDKDMNVLLVNDLVLEYYGVPHEIMKPGEPLRRSVEYLVETGRFAGGDVEQEYNRLKSLYSSGKSFRFERELHGGRFMEVNGNPLEAGGVVLNIVDVTEIRRAEQVVKRARQRLLDAIEAMDDAFTIWDSNEGLVVYNSRLIALQPELKGVVRTGMPFEEFLDAIIQFRLEGQDRWNIDKWRDEQLALFRQGGNVEIHRSNGDWHRLSYVSTRDGGRVGVRSDITQRKSWEETLVQSEQKFRHLIEGSVLGVLICTPEGNPLYVNRAIAATFGFADPDDMMAVDPVSALIDERDRQALISRGFDIANGLAAEDRARYRGIGNDGRLIWLDMAVQRINWQGQRALQCVCSDITKQVMIEHEIQQQSETFQKAVDGMPQGVAVLDQDGRVRLVNDRALELVNLSRDDVVTGGSFRNLLVAAENLRENGQGPKLTDLKKLLAQEEAFSYERQTSDGKVLEIRGNRLPDGGVVVTLVDITERKRFEDEIQRARKEADAANAAKSQFLAVMSHEIRTPMNGVMAMSELMTQTSLTQEQQSIASVIQESASVLLDIINDILDFSKIEADKLHLENVEFSLVDLVEHAPVPMATRAYEKGLEVISFVDPALPDHMVGDPTRIRQVLVNLLSNAIKFTEKGHVLIKVGKAAPEADMEGIRIDVIDTGVGIDLDQAEGLFEPFSQLDGSTAREFGGTGLGLAISKRLAEAMGGRLSVESRLDEGSTFSLDLPLQVLPERRKEDRPSLDDSRLLIVAPNRELAQALQAYGQHLGADVDIATSEVEANKRVAGKSGDYDLVVVDDRLSKGQGLPWGEDVLKQHAGLKVILLTGFLEAQRQEQAEAAGFAASLNKPVTRKSFQNAVAIALGVMEPEDISPSRGTGMAKVYEAPDRSTAEAQGCLILVVEDNPTNREVIRRQMNRLGLAIDVAENGAVALERMKKHDYGMVLTDCHMPVMDGYELVRTIRSNEEGRDTHLPVVALTADALVGTAQTCLEAGMDEYLSKPVQLAELESVVRRNLPNALEVREARLSVAQKENAEAKEKKRTRSDPDQVFDCGPLEMAFGGIDDEARGFVRDFMETLPNHYQAIKHAMAQGDLQGVYEAAHALKGASGSIGARSLSHLCADIENAAKDRDAERVRKLLSELNPHAEALEGAVKELVQGEKENTAG